jgi:zinc transport system substrate-binding protein
MVPPGHSPHDYEPTPSQMVDLADADLYFKVGSGVEFENIWMDDMEDMNDDMLVVDGSRGITLRTIDGEAVGGGRDDDTAEPEGEEGVEEGEGEEEEEEENHEEEDHEDDAHEHEGADPHIWMSLRNSVVMVENLLEGLEEVDPDNAAYYSENAEAYIEELDELDEYVEGELDGHLGERFLVYHPAFGYFAHDYGLVQMAVEEEGKEPGSAGLAAMVDQAKEYDIKVVFVSPQFDEGSARTIADEIGGEVIVLDSLVEDYLDNMKDLSERLIEGLSGGE